LQTLDRVGIFLGKTLIAISHLWAKQSTRCGGPSLTKAMQTEQLLCWSDVTDIEHTASGSNEEDNLTLNEK